jgi:hypothetical protein
MMAILATLAAVSKGLAVVVLAILATLATLAGRNLFVSVFFCWFVCVTFYSALLLSIVHCYFLMCTVTVYSAVLHSTVHCHFPVRGISG